MFEIHQILKSNQEFTFQNWLMNLQKVFIVKEKQNTKTNKTSTLHITYFANSS